MVQNNCNNITVIKKISILTVHEQTAYNTIGRRCNVRIYKFNILNLNDSRSFEVSVGLIKLSKTERNTSPQYQFDDGRLRVTMRVASHKSPTSTNMVSTIRQGSRVGISYRDCKSLNLLSLLLNFLIIKSLNMNSYYLKSYYELVQTVHTLYK